jgi:hypothetical protein
MRPRSASRARIVPSIAVPAIAVVRARQPVLQQALATRLTRIW